MVDVKAYFCKNSEPYLSINKFCKKALSSTFDMVLNRPLGRAEAIRNERCKDKKNRQGVWKDYSKHLELPPFSYRLSF